MFYNLCCIFMIFFIASTLGYIGEVTYCSIGKKKPVINRGFLMGPYIPIYGVGTVGCFLALSKYQNDFMVLFFMSAVLSTILEYLTSYAMEKLFKVRWWDYSKMPFNINGRVCLKNSSIFGIVGVLVIRLLYPFFYGLITSINPLLLEILAIIFFIVFVTDICITTTTLFSLRNTLVKFNKKDITDIAHKEVMKKVKKNNFRYNRLLKAFPDSEGYNIKDFKKLKECLYEYRNKKKKK